MNSLFSRLAQLSGKSFDEVKGLFADAKKAASRKGFKEGSAHHTQHALQVLKDSCPEKKCEEAPVPSKTPKQKSDKSK